MQFFTPLFDVAENRMMVVQSGRSCFSCGRNTSRAKEQMEVFYTKGRL